MSAVGNLNRDFPNDTPWARPPELIGRDVLRAADTGTGLQSNQIHRVSQDRFDRLWLAGPAGLACFDGHTVVNHDRRTGLACQGLRSMGIGADGTVWIGTDLGLEAIDARGKPLSWIGWSQWPYGLCEHIDASGADVWVGCAQGIACIDTSTPHAPRVKFHADIGFVRHILCMPNGVVYAASDTQGVVCIEGHASRPMQYPSLYGRQVKRLAAGRPGELLVGTNAGLVVIELATGKALHALRLQDAAPDVTALACSANEIWVGFGRDLATFGLESPHTQPVTRYTPGSRINDIMVDRHYNAWIATDTTGLCQVSCLRHAIKRIDIDNPGAVFCIKPRTNGQLEVGGERLFSTLWLSDGGQVQHVHQPSVPATTVWDSAQTAQGHWLATHAGLFFSPSGEAHQRVHADDPVLGAPARVLLARGSDLWVGTLRGLSRLRDGVAQEIRPVDGRPFGYVYAMCLDAQQRLWVATLGRGLWRESQDGWAPVLGGPLTGQGNTYAVAHGADGQTVVVQDQHVVLLAAEHNTAQAPRLLEERFPVAGWSALWLDSQRIAIGASDGLRVLDAADGSVRMQVHSLLPGPEWEFTNNRALVADNQNRLLCGVNGGLVRVDLQRLQAMVYPPTVRLVDTAWQGVIPQLVNGQHEVQPGRWTVRVRVGAAWFVDHANLRFRFKLQGFDAEWSALQEAPTITYTSLPPGSYQLLVQAWSPLTGLGAEVALLDVSVQRPWWTSGWLSSMTALDRWYHHWVSDAASSKALSDRNQALESEIEQRVQSLRAANEALQHARAELQYLKQTDELTQLTTRIRFEEQLQQEMRRAWRLRVPVSLLLMNLDQFRAVNDSLGTATGDSHLRAIADLLRAQIRDATDTACRINGDEFAIFLVGTFAEEASQFARRLQTALQTLALPHPDPATGRIRASYGIVTLQPGEAVSHHKLLARAGQALQHAKQHGRDRIVNWSASLPAVTAAPSSPDQSPA